MRYLVAVLSGSVEDMSIPPPLGRRRMRIMRQPARFRVNGTGCPVRGRGRVAGDDRVAAATAPLVPATERTDPCGATRPGQAAPAFGDGPWPSLSASLSSRSAVPVIASRSSEPVRQRCRVPTSRARARHTPTRGRSRGPGRPWRPRSGGRRPRRGGDGRPPRCWRSRSPRSDDPSTAARPTR